MKRSDIHQHGFERDDGSDVTVEFTWKAGLAAHYGSMTYPGHPAEPPEVEILVAWEDLPNVPVELTDAEIERMTAWLVENYQPQREYED